MPKRPFQVTINGSKETGAMISVCVWATNYEKLFYHLQATIMCNRNIEIFDVENNRVFAKRDFMELVARNELVSKAFFNAETDQIELLPVGDRILLNDAFVRAVCQTQKFRNN